MVALRLVRTRSLAFAAAAAAAVAAFVACGSTGDEAVPGDATRGATAPPPPPASAPTWYRDVEPIVHAHCSACHRTNATAAFAFDAVTATSLAPLVADRVVARVMPPWPPGPLSAPLAGSRALGDGDIATIAAWADAGAPLGDARDHAPRPPLTASVPSRAPDLHLEVAEANAYAGDANPFVTDEVRCFVLDLPAALASGISVTAARWRAGTSVGVHDMGGFAVDAEGAVALRARERRDGRGGFECSGGLGDVRAVLLGAAEPGNEASSATMLPPGVVAQVPAGGAVVLRVHYGVKHLDEASDRSSVDLWLAEDGVAAAARKLVPLVISAPVEVPCPTGVASATDDPCSRESAFARLAPGDPDARTRADAKLAACGTSLDALFAGLPFTPGGAERFVVRTTCGAAAPASGIIRFVRPHLRTRGASARVEAEQADGTWRVVIDIPRWEWWWAGAYALAEGVPVVAGRQVRVTCTFDNGTANQWSALTGEPGHLAPARAPRLPPTYLVGGAARGAESCAAELAIEPLP